MRGLKILAVMFVLFSSMISSADELDDFIEDSRSENSRIRAGYAETLGNYKDERAFNRLIELVQDEDLSVQWNAAESLAKFGDKRAIPVLKDAIRKTKGAKDFDDDRRSYLGEALYQLGDESLMPFWIERLEEQNRWLTELFVRAMAEYGYRGKEASDILIKDLQHENEWVKKCAAYALAYTQETRAFDALLPLLVDSSDDVREIAILALGYIGNKEATPYLILSLNDDNSRMKIAAFYSLHRLADPRAALGLIEALKTEQDRYFRQYLVVALGKIKSREAVPVLLSILDEQDEQKGIANMPLKADIIKALGEIGDKRVKERLEELFKEVTSPDAQYFSSSGSGGGKRGDVGYDIPPLYDGYPITGRVSNSPFAFKTFSEDRILNDPDYADNLGVIIKKALLKIEAAKQLTVADDFDRAQYDAMIGRAQAKLESFKPGSTERIMRQIESEKRAEAPSAQEPRGTSEVVTPKEPSLDTLKAALKNSDINVRKNALEELIKREGDYEAFLLIEQFMDDPDKQISRQAALAVAVSSSKSIPILIDILKDKKLINTYIMWEKLISGEIKVIDQNEESMMEDSSMVSDAIIALEVIKAPEASNVFIELLNNDFDDYTNSLLIHGLGGMGDKKAIPALKPFLANEATKKETIIALGKLGDESVLPLLFQYLKGERRGLDYMESMEAFVGIGKPAVPGLIKTLKSDNPEIKEMATFALGAIGDKSATPHLLKMIDENSPKVTSDVILALGRLGDKQALPALIELYNSKKVNLRKEILIAFAGLPDLSIKQILLEVARDAKGEPEFRCSAIQTLGKIQDASVIPLLEGLLKEKDAIIRLHAAYALCKSGKIEYESYLKEALQDERLSYPAMSMLLDLKGEEATELIINEAMKGKTESEKELMRRQLQQIIQLFSNK